MKYFGGCDVGSTYTKAVILDENGNETTSTKTVNVIEGCSDYARYFEAMLSTIGPVFFFLL